MPDVDVASSTSPGDDDGDADDVLARLRANDDARRREAAMRRLARESDRRGITADGDDPVVARARFDAARATCEKALRALMMEASSASSASAERDETWMMGALRETHARVCALHRDAAAASARASAYESRVMREEMRALGEMFERCKARVRPREKFRFASRGRRTRDGGDAEAKKAEAKAEVDAETTTTETTTRSNDGPGIRDRSNETIVATDATEEDDYALERLTDCDVFVFGACRALRAYDLTRCRVYALAVSGSAHVENIVDSVFCVAARQLRAHGARRTRFHARVASRPVVEDSREVAFAPRVALEDAHAAADDALLRKHGLDVENGLWREVDDFLWLRASQSPHWRALEEDARDADARDIRERAARVRDASSSS
jgi:hypothetical protein